jgi:hypothetical protein
MDYVLKGHGFNRAERIHERMAALAAEGWFSSFEMRAPVDGQEVVPGSERLMGGL